MEEFTAKEFGKKIDKSNLRGFQFEDTFNLSEKRVRINPYFEWDESNTGIMIKDVKEFIRLDFDNLQELFNGMITWVDYWERREKLVGDKLK